MTLNFQVQTMFCVALEEGVDDDQIHLHGFFYNLPLKNPFANHDKR